MLETLTLFENSIIVARIINIYNTQGAGAGSWVSGEYVRGQEGDRKRYSVRTLVEEGATCCPSLAAKSF